MIASSALFLACKITNHKIDKNAMDCNRSYLDIFKVKEFSKCVAQMVSIWNTIRTTTNFANFEAVYNKYHVQHSFIGKALEPPHYNNSDLDQWFYSN